MLPIEGVRLNFLQRAEVTRQWSINSKKKYLAGKELRVRHTEQRLASVEWCLRNTSNKQTKVDENITHLAEVTTRHAVRVCHLHARTQ